ncbi:hypothetical protein HNQ81_000873 [Desulfoprunum benzoelyticum]|uniref:Uncharacterized protein n=1 Tax=Desulfoprunum benzoelyticum TaxID=1506996 RepID=A0A840V027_9BACT|nr:hypothetical protein [Desulfoprunum benzoelyticum]
MTVLLFPIGPKPRSRPRCHFEAQREILLFPVGRRSRFCPRCHFEAKREISLFPVGRRSRFRPRCHFEAQREILLFLCRSPFQILFEISPCGRDDSGGRSRLQSMKGDKAGAGRDDSAAVPDRAKAKIPSPLSFRSAARNLMFPGCPLLQPQIVVHCLLKFTRPRRRLPPWCSSGRIAFPGSG